MMPGFELKVKEEVIEKKAKLSLCQKKAKMSQEAPKPLPSDQTDRICTKDSRAREDVDLNNGLTNDCKEEDSVALDNSTLCVSIDDAVSAAFTSVGESICPFCHKPVASGSVDQHWKTCLQKFKLSPTRRPTPVSPSDDKDATPFVCGVCNKDLSHMNEVRRNQHVNRCVDSSSTHTSVPCAAIDLSWECPFCRKMTVHKTRVAHLKQCGSSRKVPFQKLLEILHLLDRQAAERQSAGLPPTVPPRKEGTTKATRPKPRETKAKLEPRSAMEADLHMGVALSASLKEEADRRLRAELREMGLENHNIQPLPSTSSVIPPLEKARRRKKGICEDGKSLPMLLVRTAAERHSVIASKIQNIILEVSSDDDDDDEESREGLLAIMRGTSQQKLIQDCKQERSQLLSSLISKDQPLLKLSGTAQPGNTDKRTFYVENLHPRVRPTQPKAIAKTKFIATHSQGKRQSSAGNYKMPIRDDFMPSTQEALSSLLQLNNDSHFEDNAEHLDTSGFCLSDTDADGFIREELSPPTTRQTSLDKASQLIQAMASMVANEECSDVVILTLDGSIAAHRFVFCIRCKELYQEATESGASISWPVSTTSAHWFLTYIYTGQIDGLGKENKNVIEQVQLLAKRYNIQELLAYCDDNIPSSGSKSSSTSSTVRHQDDTTRTLSPTTDDANENTERMSNLQAVAKECCVQVKRLELNADLRAVTLTQNDLEQMKLPVSQKIECLATASYVSKPGVEDAIPRSCIEMDDSSSSLWSHDSDVMEVDVQTSDANLLQKETVDSCLSSLAGDNESDKIVSQIWKGEALLGYKPNESDKLLNQKRLQDDNLADMATIAETTMNGGMSTTTDLFEEEPTSFVVPNCLAYRNLCPKNNTPSSLRDSIEPGSARRSLMHPRNSPTRAASTSTPLLQSSSPTHSRRAENFYSISSIEASPSRRVRVSSNFGNSPPTSYVRNHSEEHSQLTPSSPVFLSVSNMNCSVVLEDVFVEDSLARIRRIQERRAAHSISDNSESDREDHPSPSSTPPRNHARRHLTDSGREDQPSPYRLSSTPPSNNARRRLTDSAREDHPSPYSLSSTPPRNHARRRLTDLSGNINSQSLTQSQAHSADPTPHPPPNSRCSSADVLSQKLVNSGRMLSARKRSSPEIQNHSSDFGDIPLNDDIWQDFDDDGGFNLDSPVLIPEEDDVQEVSNVRSPVVVMLPKKSRLESPITAYQQQHKDPSNPPCSSANTLLSSQLSGSPTKKPSNATANPLKPHQPIGSPATSRRLGQLSTHSPKRNLTAPVTPMPTYDSMTTPELAGALKKYGVRQFPRKKAIPVLKHIYEGTHPLVTDSEHEVSFQKPNEKHSPMKPHGRTNPVNNDNDKKDEEEEVLNLSQSSTSTSSTELLEETYLSSGGDELSASQETANIKDLDAFLRQFFVARRDWHQKILLYEPLHIPTLQAEIKAAGMKHSLSQLMDFLDDQCITFTLGKPRRRTKRRCRKGKGNTPSPKRKKKT